MADLSKIKLNNTTYNIKDTIARYNIEHLPNATSQTAGLMSADDKLVLDNLNPNVVVTLDNIAVEQIDLINAKQMNAISFQGIIEPQIGAQIRTSNLLDANSFTPGFYIGSNGSLNSNANDKVGEFIPVSPGDVIYYTGDVGPTTSSSINRRLHVYNSNQTWIKQLSFAGSLKAGNHWSTHGTIPSNGAYVRVSWGSEDTNVMISVGNPAKYEPYYITPYTPLQSITIYNSPDGTVENAVSASENIPASAGNVYSAKFDPINGKIYRTSNYIASYNGETITTKWWSDRDVYEEGASPTTGAEVVYLLDEEDYIEYDATPVDLPLFYRENHIWAENGLITLFAYYAETFAATHMTVYNGVTFGQTHIVEQDVINWNNTVQDVSDLYETKADIASPTFTGSPSSSNPGRADNSTRIATTSFVQNLQNNIAPVETNNKASQNYVVGDLLIMNGILYSVTSAIASGQTIAAGTNVVATTIRNNRDQLAFYGLASIAGDTTQAQSNNAAGVYTEDAARAIRKMLGIDETPELIADVTTTEDLTTITINKDLDNNSFALKMAKIEVILPASTTEKADWITAYYNGHRPDGTTITFNAPTVKMYVAERSLNIYEFESHGGLYFNRAHAARDFGGSGNNILSNNVDGFITDVYSFRLNQYSSTSTLIPSGTRIKIYGIRI